MKFPRCVLGMAFCCLAASALAQPYGLSNRVSVPSLNLPPTPPVTGYATSNAFGALTFTDPVVITSPPGETNRLFIVEQNGIVAVITNLAAPNRTVFLDIVGQVLGGVPNDERGLLGMAFHPDYAANGYFYVYYTVTATTAAGSGMHQRLSRFQVSANPNAANSASQAPILTMFDQAGNHNGGDIHFGADGYLYLSLGDEGDANDTRNNSQIIDKDLWAGIIRLDVDNRGTNLVPNPHPAIHAGTYRVPSDNPYVGVTTWYGSNLVPAQVRTEFYAIGLRNPWRMSFDRLTGWLYCGDVGQGAREEIDIIVKGGNYGWAFREGLIAGPKPAPPGATHINPILDYGHGSATNQGFSVTGGVVYRGSRIPALQGRYIFADYVSDNIWSLYYTGTTAMSWVRLTSDADIAGFGTDPRNGDVLLADQGDDTIKRLEPSLASGAAFPATLADSGIFADLATLTPHDGIVPYEVNLPYWSDHAIKSRWFYFPPARTITFRATANWTFPTGSVWIQHFDLELTNGLPESRQRLETRLLVRDSGSGVYGITYRWGTSTSNATLVPDGGMEETFVVNDGGNLRTQVWRYPGRSECLNCHTPATQGGLALGFNSPQLNRNFDYSGIVDNQLRAMANAGYFLGAVSNLYGVRWLASLTDETVSVEQRVRSWLAVNCAGCHFSAFGTTGFDTRIFTPLLGTTPNSGTKLINGTLNNTGGDPNNRVIVPDSLSNSMLLTRIATRGAGQMPPLGTGLVDSQAVALISRWITEELPSLQTFAQWQVSYFGSTNAPNGQSGMDPDNDGANNYEEYLTGTHPMEGADAWAIGIQRAGDTVEMSYTQLINRGIEIQWTTNLTNPAAWQFLNVPQNRPFLSATNGTGVVPDVISNGPPKYYRGRVFEP